MTRSTPIKRRSFLKAAAGGAGATALAAGFGAPALAKDQIRWRMVTAWLPNFPGAGTAATLFARRIEAESDGRLSIQIYAAGELVPAFEAMDAVSRGTAQVGHGAPYYWKGKLTALQYLAAIPFGPTAQEQNAWFQFGGGQELADKLYGQLNCKFFPCGNTGVQMGGWFNREINSIGDFSGLKMRIPGLGGEVLRAAGATPDNLPLGEILPALQSGRIDATEFVGPYNDLALGLYRNARYYYYPGWHEPATCLDCFINLEAWSALSDDLKAIVEGAATQVNQLVLSEFVSRNGLALNILVNQHGVELRPFSRETLTALGQLSGEVLADLTASDAESAEVFSSLNAFRREHMGWSDISEHAVLSARGLPYNWPG